VSWCFLCLPLVAAPSVRVGTLTQEAAPLIRLPPLALVQQTDDSGDTWRESGEHPASFAATRSDFRVCLNRQGWHRLKTISLGKHPRPSEITVWQKGSRRVLLMLWERSVGKSGFAWQEET